MNWFYKSGALAKDGWDLVVDSTIPGWRHTGLRVGTLGQNQSFELAANENERIIFALEGSGIDVEYKLDGENSFTHQFLRGRKSPFHGTADLLYVPLNTEVRIKGDGRVAVGEAPAANTKPARYITAEEVPVFVRGAGRESRQVHNFGVPEFLDADRFIVVEVIVPSGNWSGIPPHKHDSFIEGIESNLEEIYYFETATTRGFDAGVNSDPYGVLRAYASDDRPIDIHEDVRTGDVGLIPYGWHGPVSAAPGADLYFFNVMAGPDPDRSWNITDDPNHAWIRETWRSQDADPRLPYSAN